MKFYLAGYYLIQGSPKPSGMDKENLLPDKIWSGSSHICPKFPDAWILGWSSNREMEAEHEQEQARKTMKLSVDKFANAQKNFNELFEENLFGFPNVFMTAEVALKKYHQYFAAVPDLKLVGLGLPETYLEKFFASPAVKDLEAAERNGVYRKLSQEEICDQDGSIGYDLLGFDGADYCSFLCGSMESEIHDKYGVQYNQFGLIAKLEQAEHVSQAIASGEEIAEDGFWAPWLVSEIRI